MRVAFTIDFGRTLARPYYSWTSIGLGDDFVVVLERAIRGSAALIAVIGPRWLDARDASGMRRLDDPSDVVRNEIAMAGQCNVPIFPVLIDRAVMPGANALPSDIKFLASRNALPIRNAAFHQDVQKLVAVLEKTLQRDPAPALAETAIKEGAPQSSQATFRYPAALSYSHADAPFARWLCEALEQYVVCDEFVGQPSLIGPVPRRILPIYLSRYDVAESLGIGDAVISALASSRTLIVVCSPGSARSPHVGQEISEFLGSGRADCIVPILVTGDLGPHDESPIPTSLRTRVAAGALRLVDVRGLQRSAQLIAVVARLVGVPTVRLIELEETRKRRRLLQRVIALLAISAAAGVLMYLVL
jgi:hypothetical protein